jgi:diguanylate cyclase (GGDEF)-like protein/PAS domain S-box-containing protein
MKRISPTFQLTLGLIFLSNILIVAANAVFNVMPDPTTQLLKVRKSVGEGLATQVAILLQTADRHVIERTLDALRQRAKDVRSIAVRRADQQVMAEVGDHELAWTPPPNDRSTLTHVVVPLMFGTDRWGTFEMSYFPDPRNAFSRALTEPLWITILFVSLGGLAAYWLYLRRALMKLDPSSVIPDRVRAAYDVMAEAVVLLDAQGRILLANNSFRTLHGKDGPTLIGVHLSALPWLAANLPDDSSRHPWAQTMADRARMTSRTVEIETATDAGRKFVISCAPITDSGGSVHGCVVAMNDITELHRTNEQLRETLVELAMLRDAIARRNEELEQMATRDPLTGNLNRRAFFEQMEAARAASSRTGAPLSCLVVDIDRFKSVNETYGHAIGDRVIQEVAKNILSGTRTKDLICRYGGEEFCVGLPNADRGQAAMVAERVRREIETQCGPAIREIPHFRLTASIGVVTLDGAMSLSQAIEAAEQALGHAKRTGRNRVWEASGPPANHSASAPSAAIAAANAE